MFLAGNWGSHIALFAHSRDMHLGSTTAYKYVNIGIFDRVTPQVAASLHRPTPVFLAAVDTQDQDFG